MFAITTRLGTGLLPVAVLALLAAGCAGGRLGQRSR